MPVRISELPVASSLGGSEQVPVVQGGETRRATASMFASVPVPPPVVAVTATSRLITSSDAGRYLRFTASGAKVAYFDPDEGYVVGDEFHVANRSSSGNLTLHAAASFFTLRAPKGGTLVLEPNDTVTVKMSVGDSGGVDTGDVFGSTSNA